MNYLFKVWAMTLVGSVISGCTQNYVMGEWPSKPQTYVQIDLVSLKGRLVVIDQKPRRNLVAFDESENFTSDYDKYSFWDYCRYDTPEWILVEYKRRIGDAPVYDYTKTVMHHKDGKKDTDPTITSGRVTRKISNFADLRKEGLRHFKPGLMKCEKDPKMFLYKGEKKTY